MNAWVESLPQDKVQAWLTKHGDKACATHRTTDKHFALWLHYLDRACMRRIVMGYSNLEDWPYYDAYEGGLSPIEACTNMLEDLGYWIAYDNEEY